MKDQTPNRGPSLEEVEQNLLDALANMQPLTTASKLVRAALYGVQAIMAQPAQGDGAEKPSGYAYRYQALGGSVIRFNDGREVNGSRPIETLPYWFAAPPKAQLAASDKSHADALTEEQIDAIEKGVELLHVVGKIEAACALRTLLPSPKGVLK